MASPFEGKRNLKKGVHNYKLSFHNSHDRQWLLPVVFIHGSGQNGQEINRWNNDDNRSNSTSTTSWGSETMWHTSHSSSMNVTVIVKSQSFFSKVYGFLIQDQEIPNYFIEHTPKKITTQNQVVWHSFQFLINSNNGGWYLVPACYVLGSDHTENFPWI